MYVSCNGLTTCWRWIPCLLCWEKLQQTPPWHCCLHSRWENGWMIKYPNTMCRRNHHKLCRVCFLPLAPMSAGTGSSRPLMDIKQVRKTDGLMDGLQQPFKSQWGHLVPHGLTKWFSLLIFFHFLLSLKCRIFSLNLAPPCFWITARAFWKQHTQPPSLRCPPVLL